ncbi:hypothetical protein IMG5_155700 [Ichthyophthirius multifiliis]|uniref:Trichocyst matrix protein n=1 Tax=Ichthyophthirius multifiliis TaxID=5932 RepID=G0QZB8_ICHMU|nr:hypothetical protein IMG5_155700 [Ichthyophthirius multifiliis]EGR29421.1 hypothetical protein IMG5_155700 [Ichthyophthirius multifiliis]|eukprot:XP_004030657.1 hypothetical protein IMG5_155700 [Ichthyophthirius multifiliis]
MKTQLISVLLLINLTLSSAVFLQKPRSASNKQFEIFSSLQKVEMIDFGKRILDTIALQLTNKVPLAEVAKVLSQLKQDLEKQQADADVQHGNDEANCRTETERYETNIANAAIVRENSAEALKVLEAEIGQLENSIAYLDRQAVELEKRLDAYKGSRERDNQRYNEHRVQQLQVVEALELIIDRLSQIKPESSEEALLQLSKIGKSNPILSLVQVASTFSAESLANVVGKLNSLRDSLNQSINNEETQESKSKHDYEALVIEQEQTLNNVITHRAQQSLELQSKKQGHDFHSNRYKQAIAEHQFNVEGLAKLNESCANLRSIYEKTSVVRGDEIKTIVQVQNILATKLETMKDYLKQRAEADE